MKTAKHATQHKKPKLDKFTYHVHITSPDHLARNSISFMVPHASFYKVVSAMMKEYPERNGWRYSIFHPTTLQTSANLTFEMQEALAYAREQSQK